MKKRTPEFIAIALQFISAGFLLWSIQIIHNRVKPRSIEVGSDNLIVGMLAFPIVLSIIWIFLLLMQRGQKKVGWILIVEGFVGIVITQNTVDYWPALASILYSVSGFLILFKAYRMPTEPENKPRKPLSRSAIILLILLLNPVTLSFFAMVFVFGLITIGRNGIPSPTPDLSTPVPTAIPQYIFRGKVNEGITDGSHIILVSEVEQGREYGTVKAKSGNKLVAVNITYTASYSSIQDTLTYDFYLNDDKRIRYNNLSDGKQPPLSFAVSTAKGRTVSGWRTFEVPEDTTELTLNYFDKSLDTLISIELGNLTSVTIK